MEEAIPRPRARSAVAISSMWPERPAECTSLRSTSKVPQPMISPLSAGETSDAELRRGSCARIREESESIRMSTFAHKHKVVLV